MRLARTAFVALAAAVLPFCAVLGQQAPSAAGQAAPGGAAPSAEPSFNLDKQASHPNGTTVVINSVTLRRTSIVLNVTVTTAGENSKLNDYGLVLVDDTGARYAVVPPTGDKDINVPKNSAMDGDLVFSGRLNPAARRLTLIVNERAGSAESRSTNTPQMRIELPLPQRSGELIPSGEDEPVGQSQLAAAALPDPDAPLRTAALASSSLAAAAQEAGPGSRSGFGSARGGTGLGQSSLSVQQLRQELRTQRTDRGEVVSLSGDILFDFDKWALRRDAEPTLRRVAQLITATRPARVLVEGHTDARGNDAYNQRLSERRAGSVADWLAARGDVMRTLLRTAGYGRTRPVAANNRPDGSDDPDGRQRNRRVEVVLQQG